MPDKREEVPCNDPDCDRTFTNAGAAATHYKLVHSDAVSARDVVDQAEPLERPPGDDSWRDLYAKGGDADD